MNQFQTHLPTPTMLLRPNPTFIPSQSTQLSSNPFVDPLRLSQSLAYQNLAKPAQMTFRPTTSVPLQLQALLNKASQMPRSPQQQQQQPQTPFMLGFDSTSPRSNLELNNQVNSFLLGWKLQNNLQAELYRNQISQLAEMQKYLNLKIAAVQNSPQKGSPTPQLNEISPVEVHNPLRQEIHEQALLPVSKKTTKSQIRAIIQYVLANYGQISENQMEHEKLKYQDAELREVFDALVTKYSSTIKTKEEMIKYTLRKAFKYIKKGLKKEMKLDSKKASNVLCKRYFQEETEHLPDFGNQEDFLKFVLPFRKCSKNKTMNSSFIQEVFSSDEFQKDYGTYLEDVDEILEADNNSKIERFVYFIEECIKKKKIQDIKKYKRIPWPKLWVANTKKVAMELPTVAKFSHSLVGMSQQDKKGFPRLHMSPSQTESEKTTHSSPPSRKFSESKF